MSTRILIERAIAALMLILLAPVMLIIALAVRLTLGKPVIFSQIRSGLGRKTYKLLKFRTMTDARGPTGDLLPDACRTPPFGSFLRRTRMDELPQLWNIVRAEMSFVGPRPLLPPTIASMGEEGIVRCSVRPGLAGWSQVHGGPLLSLRDKLDLDLWYIRSASLRLDIAILCRTVLVVLLGDRLSHRPVAMQPKWSTEPGQADKASGMANDEAGRVTTEPLKGELSDGRKIPAFPHMETNE